MRTVTTSRHRALRAAHAVTLGSAVLFVGACGTDGGDAVDAAGSDAATDSGGGDVAADTAPDTAADTTAPDTASDTTAPDTAADTAPDTTEPDTTPDTIEPDVTPDTAPDVAPDTTADVSEPDATADVTEPDTSDAIDDTAADVADAGADVDPDASGPGCKDFEDNVCPAECVPDNDYDCCIADGPDGWCTFDPSYGCICAVEGPFAPPSLPATRVAPRAIPSEML